MDAYFDNLQRTTVKHVRTLESARERARAQRHSTTKLTQSGERLKEGASATPFNIHTNLNPIKSYPI